MHPELNREAARRWREKHPGEHYAAVKRHRAAHRESYLASMKKYRETHQETMQKARRQWRKNNPEKHQASTRQWWKKNRERGMALLHRREARKLAAPGSFTREEIKQQYEKQEGRCAWCGAELNGRYDIDHIIALTRGGSNWAWNLACACRNCNNSKKAKLPFIKWQPPNPLAGFTREWVEELITRHGNPRQLPLF